MKLLPFGAILCGMPGWIPAFAQSKGGDVAGIVFRSDSMPPYHTLINIREDDLEYHQDALGNRVPDFSYCGYMASERAIPEVPVKLLVPLVHGDATALIQMAIDQVSALAPDREGFRGTVLLQKGIYRLDGSLLISTSGVVLRGSGCGTDGTILMGDGTDRETLIEVEGSGDRGTGEEIPLSERYVPVNETLLGFDNPHPFRVGDRVTVRRPSTREWLSAIGTDHLGADDFRTRWEPGDFDMNWERRIVAVTDSSITLDAPLTNALEPGFGRGSVTKINRPGKIRQVGIENLRCISSADPSNRKDENHRWMAVTMNHADDCWARRVVAVHFVSSAVAVWEDCRRVTVEDCKSLAPVGEEGNFRRYAFQTMGQQTLFQRCYAEYAYHAFSVGFTTPGPNAFVQCTSFLPIQSSGAIGGWSTGILFDRVTVDGGDISFGWMDMAGHGGGWSAANSLCWQCRAARVILPSPPTARNWAYGTWAQPIGNGIHTWPYTFLKPESLYYDQLEKRLGKPSAEVQKILTYESDETTAPLPEEALRMSKRSLKPDLTMDQWIDSMIRAFPISPETVGIHLIDTSLVNGTTKPEMPSRPVTIENGRLVRDGKLLVGGRTYTALWRGNTRPGGLSEATPHLTRYVPGRKGKGLTDDLEEVVEELTGRQVSALSHFPSLWYERRRDDHSRMRRSDADVWTPFYEQPFSRSGQGKAFDGLSKYDLDQWNPWYWSRLRKFAGLADQHGILLIQEHYLQHNIIEEGAHWVDYPWRSANNINDLGFAEPPYFSGDKRVYMADAFYDTTHGSRRKYHMGYIRKNLDNAKGRSNVIHDIGHEFTGPLHFVQFWLDAIAAWEAENHQDVMVMLQGTKEVQDAVLSDTERSGVVDVIDIRQWHYREDGSLYAPAGGTSLTQRQYARIFNPGRTSFEQIYRAVYEYRTRYPEKAVVSSLAGGGPLSEWAVFMAGGSLAGIPGISEDRFLELATAAQAYQLESDKGTLYILEKKGDGYILFSTVPEIDLSFRDTGKQYSLKWIDPSTGKITRYSKTVTSSDNRPIRSPFPGATVAWLEVFE